jgi:hypothetical protein
VANAIREASPEKPIHVLLN